MGSYLPPDSPLSFGFEGVYTAPDPGLIVFSFSEDYTRAIPDPTTISVEVGASGISIVYGVDGQPVNLSVSASESVVEILNIIDSAESIIEAVVSQSVILKQHSVRSAPSEIGVEIKESLVSEARTYVFHFYSYLPPSSPHVDFAFGNVSADTRVVSEFVTVSMDVSASVVDIQVGVENAPADVIAEISASSIELCEKLLSADGQGLVEIGPSQVEEYHGTAGSETKITVNADSSQVEEYHDVQGADGLVAIDVTPSQIEDYHGISSAPLGIIVESVGLDVDGLVVSGQKITKIPEVVSAVSDIAVQLIAATVSGGQYQNLPVTGKGNRLRWNQATPVKQAEKSSGWKEGIVLDAHVGVPFDATNAINEDSRLPWLGIQSKADKRAQTPWQEFSVDVDRRNRGQFVILPRVDEPAHVPWGGFALQHSRAARLPYLHPPAKDRPGTFKWDALAVAEVTRAIGYKIPLPNDKRHQTFWGPYWYSLLCGVKYYPPFSGEAPPMRYNGQEWVQTGTITFKYGDPRNFRCPWNYPYSGPRSPYQPPAPPAQPSAPSVPIKDCYYIMNSTFIQRISGNMENIDFQSVTMSIDRDSWLWSFNIVLMSKTSLDLIKPSGGVYTDIEINCNGWKWTCRVENWHETIVFGQKAWTVTGKSASVELGEPYSVIPAFSNSAAQGGQIADDILSASGTGWSLDWQGTGFDPHVDWLIPADTINLTDTSIMKSIQAVTGGIGHCIQTHTDTNTGAGGTGEKKLIVRPRYKENPWDWGSSINPDVTLTDAICSEIARQNNIKKDLNFSIVYGENNGVIVKATRAGTAGDKAAVTVSDPTITTMDAGKERARQIIGDSGAWVVHTLKLFSLMPPGDAPGLLIPGDFVDMNESGTGTWRGQVTGTSIFSGWGNSGLETSQTIEVEQYEGS